MVNGDLKSGTCPPPRSVPLYGYSHLAEATVIRDRQFGNCPKVEMNGSMMLQDSDRSKGGNIAKQPSRFGVETSLSGRPSSKPFVEISSRRGMPDHFVEPGTKPSVQGVIEGVASSGLAREIPTLP